LRRKCHRRPLSAYGTSCHDSRYSRFVESPVTDGREVLDDAVSGSVPGDRLNLIQREQLATGIELVQLLKRRTVVRSFSCHNGLLSDDAHCLML